MKKIKYFLKKNFKKFLVLLSVFVIAFSCFIVSASAVSSLNVSYTQPAVNENSGYIEIFLKDSSGSIKAVNVWFFTIVGDDAVDVTDPYIRISVPSSTKVNAEVFRTSDTNVIVPLTIGYGYCSSYSAATGIAYASTLGDAFNIDCWFSAGYSVAFIKCYGICVRSPNNAPNSYFSGYSEHVVTYGKDILINNKLDILINHLTDYQSEITESIQQGNQQVINNANQNTDKILNSGEYTLDMGDSTARLETIEDSIFESVNLSGVASSIFDSATWWADLSPAIMSAGIILDELLNFGGIQYTWFMTVVRFGLAVGVLALFLAIAPNIFKGDNSSKSSKAPKSSKGRKGG